MVLSRLNSKTAFDHVLDTVLNRYNSKDLKSALIKEGYEDIITLITIDDDTIDNLTIVDPDDATKEVPIKKSDKGTLKIWKEYVFYRDSIGSPLDSN
jgi:hypothetical protein